MGEGQGPYLVEVAGRKSLYIQDGSKRVSTRTADRAAAHRELQRYIEEHKLKLKLSGDELSSLGECLEHYRSRRQQKLEKSGTWQKKYRYLHARLLDRVGDRILSDIDYRFGDEYTAARFAEGVGAEAVRQELQYVRTAWRMAHRDRRTSVEPAGYDLPATVSQKDDYFSREEAEDMIWAARGHGHVWTFLQVGFGTGARPGSVLSLTWDRVDFERGLIDFRPRDAFGRIRPGDTKKYAVCPMTDDLRDALKARKGRLQTGPVVRYRDRPVKNLDAGFARAREKAGIKRHLTPHAMRHSVITWMAQDGVPFFEIAGFVGHTSPSMLEKVYGHHNPSRMQGALKSVSLKPGARR
jgi:integrase